MPAEFVLGDWPLKIVEWPGLSWWRDIGSRFLPTNAARGIFQSFLNHFEVGVAALVSTVAVVGPNNAQAAVRQLLGDR
jgi:hypothetical protein